MLLVAKVPGQARWLYYELPGPRGTQSSTSIRERPVSTGASKGPWAVTSKRALTPRGVLYPIGNGEGCCIDPPAVGF